LWVRYRFSSHQHPILVYLHSFRERVLKINRGTVHIVEISIGSTSRRAEKLVDLERILNFHAGFQLTATCGAFDGGHYLSLGSVNGEK
jgi:hypothetical protein